MIFGRRKKEPDVPVVAEEAEDADEAISGEPEDVPPEHGADDLESEWRERAEAVIAGGASTASKRAQALLGDEPGPTHFTMAGGCRVMTPGGVELLDCTMALGAVALGYGHERVTTAVARALTQGHVSGLNSILEVQLAERLCDVVPCAEQVLFFKSGGEAVSAAVRLARTYTGRERVVGCGYFGWQDWSGDANGIPAGTRASYTRVAFDDVAALERACGQAGPDLAAVVIEPVIERLPSPEWIAAARRACDAAGAVLIFDEIKTGFRLRIAGYQELAGVEPDLAVFGKAMANGYPLAAVAGRAALMDAVRRTWITTTLGGEALALAAAIAVLDVHESEDVCADLEHIGGRMRAGVEAAIAASRCPGVAVDGLAPMWLLRFDDRRREDRFLALARAEGVLFKRGAYNFASLAHDEDALASIESAASHALVALREELG